MGFCSIIKNNLLSRILDESIRSKGDLVNVPEEARGVISTHRRKSCDARHETKLEAGLRYIFVVCLREIHSNPSQQDSKVSRSSWRLQKWLETPPRSNKPRQARKQASYTTHLGPFQQPSKRSPGERMWKHKKTWPLSQQAKNPAK